MDYPPDTWSDIITSHREEYKNGKTKYYKKRKKSVKKLKYVLPPEQSTHKSNQAN